LGVVTGVEDAAIKSLENNYLNYLDKLYFFIIFSSTVCFKLSIFLHYYYAIIATCNVRTSFHTGREKSTENGAAVDRIAAIGVT
jgi:hypothetical protein